MRRQVGGSSEQLCHCANARATQPLHNIYVVVSILRISPYNLYVTCAPCKLLHICEYRVAQCVAKLRKCALAKGQRQFTVSVTGAAIGSTTSQISGASIDERPDPFWAIRPTHDAQKVNVKTFMLKVEAVEVFGWSGTAGPTEKFTGKASAVASAIEPPPVTVAEYKKAAGKAATKSSAAKAATAPAQTEAAPAPAQTGRYDLDGMECVVGGIPVIINTKDIATGTELRIYQAKTEKAPSQVKEIKSRDLVNKKMGNSKRDDAKGSDAKSGSQKKRKT